MFFNQIPAIAPVEPINLVSGYYTKSKPHTPFEFASNKFELALSAMQKRGHDFMYEVVKTKQGKQVIDVTGKALAHW